MSTYVSRAGIYVQVKMTDKEYKDYCQKNAIGDDYLNSSVLNIWTQYREDGKKGFVLLLSYEYDECFLDFNIDSEFLKEKEETCIIRFRQDLIKVGTFAQVYYNGSEPPEIFK